MWRELISALTAHKQPVGGLKPGPDYFHGATPEQLDTVEQKLGVSLPDPFRDLLGESNGVLVTIGQHMIWNTDELVEDNWSGCVLPAAWWGDQTSHRLFFFGDAGADGIRFAFLVTEDDTVVEQIHAWYPIGRVQVQKASSLRDYIESWLSGSMTV